MSADLADQLQRSIERYLFGALTGGTATATEASVEARQPFRLADLDAAAERLSRAPRDARAPALGPLGGLPVISSPACTAHVGYAFTLPIAPSRHRSRRIWKKLAKRRRLSARPIVEPTAYMTPHGLIAHPRIVAELMAERGL